TPRERQPPEEAIVSSNVVRALRGASYDFASKPEDAVRRFRTAVDVLGESWVGLEHAQRLASLELAVDFLLRSSGPSDRWASAWRGAAFAGVAALRERASLDRPAVLRGVWSAGLTTRLLREPGAEQSLREAAAARAGALGAEVPAAVD